MLRFQIMLPPWGSREWERQEDGAIVVLGQMPGRTSLLHRLCRAASDPTGHGCFSAEVHQVGARAENALVTDSRFPSLHCLLLSLGNKQLHWNLISWQRGRAGMNQLAMPFGQLAALFINSFVRVEEGRKQAQEKISGGLSAIAGINRTSK